MNDSFIEALSSPDQPIPGGGAAAAYAGSIGLALLEKIVRLEMRRDPMTSESSFWKDLLEQVCSLSNIFFRLCDEDGKSYMLLAETKASRKKEAEVAAALVQTIECPMKILEQTHTALSYVSMVAEHCKRHLLSDLQVVCELLGAAGHGAYHICIANLRLMTDPISKADYQSRITRLHDRSRELINLAKASILRSDHKL
ncbi:MAG: cyclodeaminase/cyclohydrolase family protein [Desulfobacterales bacterium]|jgi:formiminotetrahydrofolate cyclodeaminase